MCIGMPMQVVELVNDGTAALCRTRAGATETLDLALTGPLAPGTWVLSFIGAARAVMSEDEALRTADALDALSIAAAGGSVDHLFADLVDREPELPPHLRGSSD